MYDGAKAAASRLKLASTSAYHSASEAAAPHLAKGMEKAAELYEKTSSTIASSPVARPLFASSLIASSMVAYSSAHARSWPAGSSRVRRLPLARG